MKKIKIIKLVFAILFCTYSVKAQTSTNTVISASPNPFAQYTFITFTLSANDTITEIVYNLSGQNIITMHSHVFFSAGIHQDSLNMSAFADGIYLVSIMYSGTAHQAVRIIKSGSAGISILNNGTPISVYPNPVVDIIVLEAGAQNLVNAYSLTDIEGQQLDSKALRTNKCEIDVSNYPPGIYFLRIQTEAGNKCFKIIKE